MSKKSTDQARDAIRSRMTSAAAAFVQPLKEEERNTYTGTEDSNTIDIEENTAVTNGENSTPLAEANSEVEKEDNKEVDKVMNSEVEEYIHKDVQEAEHIDVTKESNTYRKMTISLDEETIWELDMYITQLRQEAIRRHHKPITKSEWLRELIRRELREKGAIQ